jgi:hypothetical protein
VAGQQKKPVVARAARTVGAAAFVTLPFLLAFPFVERQSFGALGFLFFCFVAAYINLSALRDGFFRTRQEGIVTRASDTGVFWLLFSLSAVVSAACGTVSIAALLGFVRIGVRM